VRIRHQFVEISYLKSAKESPSLRKILSYPSLIRLARQIGTFLIVLRSYQPLVFLSNTIG